MASCVECQRQFELHTTGRLRKICSLDLEIGMGNKYFYRPVKPYTIPLFASFTIPSVAGLILVRL